MEQQQNEFGVRWLLRRFGICPNAYYSYRKHRKAGDYAQKTVIQEPIKEIYHEHTGVDGYRTMAVYLARRGYRYSPATIHKYMNTELDLHSVVRPKKPGTRPGKPPYALTLGKSRHLQPLFFTFFNKGIYRKM